MPETDDNKPPKGTPGNPATNEDWEELEMKKHLSPEVKPPNERAFFAQINEASQAHATTPDMSELEVARTQALTPDFDPTAPPPKLDAGGPPPTVPPKEPPSGGGGAGEDSSKKNLWFEILESLFKNKLFVAAIIGLSFLIVGNITYYWINKFNNSPKALANQKENIKLLKEMQDMQDKAPKRSMFSSAPLGTVESNCTITASFRQGNQKYQEDGRCARIKYESIPNDPGMLISFEGRRPVSIEGRYRLLNGKELLCQTENPSGEKFSTDGCSSALADKRLTSVGFGPLSDGGIVVSYPPTK